MKNELKNIDFLVVGAGIPGILASSHLKSLQKNAQILIVEVSDEVGGLYKSTLIPEINQWVDYGMHVYYESGVHEFDNFIKSALDEDQWINLVENKKDIAGIYWKGMLRKDHPYPDVRDKKIFVRLLHFFSILSGVLRSKLRGDNALNAQDLALNQFGFFTYKRIYKPILTKLYDSHPSELDTVAMLSPELRRIAIFEKNLTKKLSKFRSLKARLAYPNQFEMPLLRERNQIGMYPKKLGFGQQVLAPLINKITDAGIEVSVKTKVEKIKKEKDHFEVSIKRNNLDCEYKAKKIVWCAPVSMLNKLLDNLTLVEAKGNPHRKKMYLTAIIKGDNHISPLYYFYVYDKNFSIFRITNYASFSEEANVDIDEYLIGIEFWDYEKLSTEDLIEKCIKELNLIGIFKNARLKKIWVLPDIKSPPEATSESVQAIGSSICNIYNKFSRKDLLISGPFTSKNIFFLQDVLRDLKLKLDIMMEESCEPNY